MDLLAKLFCSRVRAEIIRLLFGLSPNPLHLREIHRKAGLAVGTIQRDIAQLVKMDLVVRRLDGNRVYFSANNVHPLTPELRRIVLKTVGLADTFRQALGKKGFQSAFIFGSIATGSEHDKSDVDLMVIGELGVREISRRLTGVADQIGREINPHVLSATEFAERRRSGEHFISTVMGSPRIWIQGNEDDIGKMGG